MRWLAVSLGILLLAVMLGLYLQQDPGYVILARGTYTLEMSLTVFALLVLGGFISLWLLIYGTIRLWGLPGSLKRWRLQQRRERARRETSRGLIELAQGNWQRAEQLLVRYVSDSETPLLNYLAAARAAHKQNQIEKRNDYLQQARLNLIDSTVAVDLTQAELQLNHGELAQAHAILIGLYDIAPRHPQVLYLLARVHEGMRNWPELYELLPVLRKRDVLDGTTLRALELRAARELLTLATQQGKVENLKDIWKSMSRNMQQDADMVRHYARCLLTLEQPAIAEELLREVLRRQYDRDLVYLYGLLEVKEKDKQLVTAESWLKGHERDPVLLLTLGRLCFRNQLWGKARSYLDASVGIEPQSDTYRELGQLLEKINQPKEAAEYYRKGLLLAQDEKIDGLLMVIPQPQAVLPVC